ncbi:MAG: efflux RND transporter periplasmic adaptor subunit [Luteolibacter sp.]
MNAPEHDVADDSPPEPRHPVRLGLISFVLIVLIAIGGIAGFLPRMHQQEKTRNDTAELAETTVALISPQPGKKEDGLILPAEVTPMLQASIYARVNGYLKRWKVDIGARVKAGDVLAEIETPETDRALDQARAQFGVAEVNLKLAQTTDLRWQGLLKVNAVPKQEADEKTAAVDVAKATLEAERANVHRLEELQGFQKVVAPFDGIITIRNVDIGDLINAGGSKELFHLAQTERLRVYVRVPQTQAMGITVGQEAELLIPEQPDEKFPARVTTTSEAISATSRTLLTELQVENPKGLIRAGSYAQVRFASVSKAPQLTVPSNTLIFRAEGLQLAVVDGEGIVHLHKIEIGRDFGERVEVLSGVTATDRIIASPFDSLVDGMKVRVAEEHSEAKGN